MKKIQLDQITPDQLSELQQLAFTTFQQSFAHLNTPGNIKIYNDYAFSDSKLSEELNDPDSIFYFAILEGKKVGYLKLNQGITKYKDAAHGGMQLERIYVLAEYQRQQIGQQMLDFVIAQAKAAKASELWLGVWEKNVRAIEFYERHGFEKGAKMPFQMGEELQWDYRMRYKKAL